MHQVACSCASNGGHRFHNFLGPSFWPHPGFPKTAQFLALTVSLQAGRRIAFTEKVGNRGTKSRPRRLPSDLNKVLNSNLSPATALGLFLTERPLRSFRKTNLHCVV